MTHKVSIEGKLIGTYTDEQMPDVIIEHTPAYRWIDIAPFCTNDASLNIIQLDNGDVLFSVKHHKPQ